MATTLIIFLSLFLIILPVITTTLAYIIFWYEVVNNPDDRILAPCAGRMRKCGLVGFVTGVVSQATVTATYPLGCVTRLWRPRQGVKSDRPTVVFLHGLYHNPAAWFIAKRIFARRGYTRSYAPGYFSLFGRSFDQIAERLTREVETIIDQEGPVVIVGHSMGGLLARALAAVPKIGENTLAVAAMGAPHQGSKLAALAVGRVGRSLLPHGDLVKRLAALPCPDALPRLSLASPMDDMVIPLQGLESSTPGWDERVTAPVSHIFMLYHPPTLRTVADFLDVAAGTA